MQITFSVDTRVVNQEVGYPIEEGWGPKSWQATLVCDTRSGERKQKIEFQGNHPSKAEALRLAFESFLNNNVWMWGENRYEREGREEGYETLVLDMQFLPQEYRDLLWQLIDVKFGADRTAKLKIAAEFGYPHTIPFITPRS